MQHFVKLPSGRLIDAAKVTHIVPSSEDLFWHVFIVGDERMTIDDTDKATLETELLKPQPLKLCCHSGVEDIGGY